MYNILILWAGVKHKVTLESRLLGRIYVDKWCKSTATKHTKNSLFIFLLIRLTHTEVCMRTYTCVCTFHLYIVLRKIDYSSILRLLGSFLNFKCINNYLLLITLMRERVCVIFHKILLCVREKKCLES